MSGWVSRFPVDAARPCRYGADQFALARPLVEELVRSAASERPLLAHFRRTFIPTESWFHTVLGHRAGELEQQVRLHFARFDGTAHPRILGIADLAELAASPSYFARKVDASSAPLLDRIDVELLGLARPVD